MIFQNNRKYFSKKQIFFKGGGNSGDSYDAAYNARMATIAESQQDMAEDYFNFYKSDYQPMEREQIAANREMIPSETALNLEKIQAERNLIPGQEALGIAQNESALSLIPGQTQLTQTQIDDSITGIREKAPVRTAFFNETLNGVDIDSRVNNAGADAAHAFANSNKVAMRDVARMGLSPDKLLTNTNTNSLNRAKTIASARTKARTNAEDENYGRLTNAMGY